uniref:NADH-ubiquinone oxidoreductase chain 2 n=1 Tax=Pselaphinae sp. 8 EF-2015 TaxID=1756862 RepID=A0A0S2M8T8_9COLE|nr:NADH deshydrogenase subunit 2 [Pselaphinae sp. 8 EF-2015]
MNLILISTIISISSNSWFGMWLGLEINLMSIIPLMSNIKNSYSTESSIKYFIVQALSSMIIMMSMIFLVNISNSPVTNFNNSINMIFNSALMTKMGSAPFHFWFPEIMEGLNWINCFIMLTWQKITPMILLNYSLNSMFILIIIVFSMLISGIMGINQNSLRKILSYSSINHIGWMLASMMFFETIWLMYFFIYLIILSNLVLIFNLYKIFFMTQLMFFMSSNLKLNYFFIMNFLSLGGLPPFIGFLPKWFTIQIMIFNNNYFLPFMMIILTLLTLFYYVRIMMSTLSLISKEANFIKFKIQSHKWISIFNYINLLSLILYSFMFNFI